MPPTALTPLALENADLLRRLEAQDFASKTELAARLNRDRPNLNKTLKRLADEGLVHPITATLTDAGTNAVRDLARLDDAEPVPPPSDDEDGPPEGVPLDAAGLPDFIALPHSRIVPDALNPRKHFDPEALLELADSIARDGLLENLVVRGLMMEGDTAHRLVAGERRWRAIQTLILDGRWPPERPIPCRVVAIDDAAHRRIALVENLQRKDLRPIDEATALKELMALENKGTAEIAADIGFTQRFVQQRLQLLELPDALRDQLNTGALSIERGREAAALWPKLPPIKQIELREGKITVEAAKDWAADQPELEDFPPEELLILLEVAWAIAATPSNGYWTDTPCGYRLPTLPRAMETAGWLQFISKWGSDVQHVRLTPKGYAQVKVRAGTLSRAALEPLLKKARVLAVGGSPLAADHDPKAFAKVDALFKAKKNLSAWLNSPFAIDPAIAERTAAEQAQRAEYAADRERADQERAETQAAYIERHKRADTASIALLAQIAADGAWNSGEVAACCADAGHPLPWTFLEDTDETDWLLQDANGQAVDPYDASLQRLFCAFLNNAAAPLAVDDAATEEAA